METPAFLDAIEFRKRITMKKAPNHFGRHFSEKSLNYTFPSHPLNRNGSAEGELTGGNLSILCSLNGTTFFPIFGNASFSLKMWMNIFTISTG